MVLTIHGVRDFHDTLEDGLEYIKSLGVKLRVRGISIRHRLMNKPVKVFLEDEESAVLAIRVLVMHGHFPYSSNKVCRDTALESIFDFLLVPYTLRNKRESSGDRPLDVYHKQWLRDKLLAKSNAYRITSAHEKDSHIKVR